MIRQKKGRCEMKVITIDSQRTPRVQEIECSEVAMSWVDGGEIIIDNKEVVPLKKVIRIIEE